ncbi:hypothetical protein BV921_00860 [Pectobacterium odoriferum]|uniref:Uncharacterized protein n=1 Tax=Pectobacterium odoriferum TaxID=78398 RepID=A0ABD6VTY2_9GAMM|nr:hypothetical protein BV925_02310 [Pectobacterium odoriferum]POD98434.1 hypothetical protein BVY06_01685 [Pectobacterium odoriferum]POE06068.1 hypothetical protein BV916_05380 [Pectobacterium odoriferum]POE13070.1 hypothetical protein BV921_00860 [Pectobacterium odoriferum]POE14689.1 hypothetical protein BV924_03950 [Pectobacterium odoriferum]
MHNSPKRKTAIPVILQAACALATLLAPLAWTSPRWGRCKQRSNLPLADLSVTRITYLSKLIGTPSLAAFLQPELFRVYIRTQWCKTIVISSQRGLPQQISGEQDWGPYDGETKSYPIKNGKIKLWQGKTQKVNIYRAEYHAIG